MKGKPAVIDGLSEVLCAELTAINQYFHHHTLCEDWGFDLLAKAIREESIDEMKHAESISERILYLEGEPNLQKYSKIEIGKDVPDLMQKDLALEIEAVDRLNRLITLCQSEGDHGSAQLLISILADEEHHIEWIEQQISLIDSLGLQLYLSRQVSGGGGGE